MEIKKAIIKNPDELQVISNPTQTIKTISTMANKNLDQFKDQARMAGLILLGQASGATVNSLVSRNFLSGQNAIIQQAAKVAGPAIAGLALAASKNKNLYPIGLGMGVQSTLELIRLIMPNFSPQEPFADPSRFVHNNCYGQQMLPAKKAGEGEEEEEASETSKPVNGQAEFVNHNDAYLMENDVDWY